MITTSSKACARCGQDHPQLEFRPLARPMRDGAALWTHWAICPTTGEPILMCVTFGD